MLYIFCALLTLVAVCSPPPHTHTLIDDISVLMVYTQPHPLQQHAPLARSIPAFNADVQAIQKTLEDIAYLLRIPQRKPWGNMTADVAAALSALDDRPRLLAGVPQVRTHTRTLLNFLLATCTTTTTVASNSSFSSCLC